jgi:WD40 repeat protein
MKKHQYFLLIVFLLFITMDLSAMGSSDYKGITDISYSSDGSRILVSYGDGAITIWDTYNAEIVNKFAAHLGGVFQASFSKDGRYILSMGFDAYRKWDAETASLISFYPFNVYEYYIRKVYNNTGDKIIIGTSDLKRIKLINVSDGNTLWQIRLSDMVVSIFFSEDDKYAAVASYDGAVHIFEVDTGKKIIEIQTDHFDMISYIKFSPDYKYLITADERDLCLWNFQDGTFKYEIKSSYGFIKAVEFVDNGNNIRMVGSFGIGTWSTESGEQISFLDIGEMENYFSSLSTVAFSPDEKEIACYDGGTIVIMDIKTGKEIGLLNGYFTDYDFTEDDLQNGLMLLYSDMEEYFDEY